MWGRSRLVWRRLHLQERHVRNEFATSSSLSSISALRTSETNPANLSGSHLGRFYQIDQKLYEDVFLQCHAFPLEFRDNSKSFREACVLVRKPFLDIKACVEASDLSKPVVRYLLYGEPGVGKTITANCMAHYGLVKEFVMVYVPWVPLFTRYAKEIVQSTARPGFYDHTMRAVQWLNQFKSVNSNLISKLDLKTGKEYTWSKREITPAESPLLEIIDHGISRPAHASEVIYALISELKSLSSSNKCKTMVLMDGVNSMWYEHVKITKPDKTLVPPNEITVYEAFKQAFKPDWTGGVVICTVDKLANSDKNRESDLPRYLLTREGWEAFDPFVPIKVEKYTSQEVQSTIDYFLDRKWLQHPRAGSEEGRLELEFLSTRNPQQLVSLCNFR